MYAWTITWRWIRSCGDRFGGVVPQAIGVMTKASWLRRRHSCCCRHPCRAPSLLAQVGRLAGGLPGPTVRVVPAGLRAEPLMTPLRRPSPAPCSVLAIVAGAGGGGPERQWGRLPVSRWISSQVVVGGSVGVLVMVQSWRLESRPSVMCLCRRVVPGLRPVMRVPDDPGLHAIPVWAESFGGYVQGPGRPGWPYGGRGGGGGGGGWRSGGRGGADPTTSSPRAQGPRGLRHDGGRTFFVQSTVHHCPPGGVAGCGRWGSGHVAQRTGRATHVGHIVRVEGRGRGGARHGVAGRDDDGHGADDARGSVTGGEVAGGGERPIESGGWGWFQKRTEVFVSNFILIEISVFVFG